MADKPNLLFVFSDQHRASALGCYGNSEVISPNFDSFAASGLRFNNYVSNCPVCVPIRPTMLTGLLPPHHGAVANDMAMFDGIEGIADVLNANGYLTGYIGKWHMDGIPRDKVIKKERRLGFTYWKVQNCCHDYMHSYYFDEQDARHNIDGYEPITQTDLAIDFIKENKKELWALYMSWGPPHDPYMEVPQKYLAQIDKSKLTLPFNVPEEIVTAWARGHFGRNIIGREEILNDMWGYYAHIAALDEQFGRLIRELSEQGLTENTIVVYTSDHGDMLGSCGYTGKQLPYREAYNIPLLISWQGKTYKGVSNELLSHKDLPVSLLGLMGLQFSSEKDGEDFHKCFISQGAKGDNCCLIADYIPAHNAAALGHNNAWRGIVTPQYTYASFAKEAFVLFDTMNDPFQLNNLIDNVSYAEIKAELHEQLLKLLEQYGDKLSSTFDFIKENNFTQEWDKSQSYFKLPTSETGKLVW